MASIRAAGTGEAVSTQTGRALRGSMVRAQPPSPPHPKARPHDTNSVCFARALPYLRETLRRFRGY